MKNMATELCIILIGYFTLVPAIQVRGQMLELLKEVHQEKTVVKVIVIKEAKHNAKSSQVGNASMWLMSLLFILGILFICCCGAGV